MTPEQLPQLFAALGEGEQHIDQLRRLVIALAITNRLSKTFDPSEPSTHTSAKPPAKINSLESHRSEGSGGNYSPVLPDDLPQGFPNSQFFVRLGSLAKVEKGKTGILHAKPGPYRLVTTAAQRGTCDHFDFDARAAIIPLVSSTGHGNASLNRLHYEDGKFALGSILAAVIPNEPQLISARFLFEYLSAFKDELLVPQMTGTANVTLTINRLVDVPVPLVSSRVQRMVNELMTLLDRLESAHSARETVRDRLTTASLGCLTAPDSDAQTRTARARLALDALPALTTRANQIKQLRQTILDLAVRGALVEHIATDEPARRQLARLRTDRHTAHGAERLRERKQVVPLAREDLKFEFPACWELTHFDEVLVLVSGVAKGGKVSPSCAIEMPYLRVANVQRGYLDLALIKTIRVDQSDRERYLLRSGDILMTEGGDWDKLGRAAIWRNEVPECIHQNHVFRVRPPSKDISSDWVVIYVNSQLGRRYFENAAKQTTNLASINMTQLRACPLPLPPLAEQHRIVAKVDELMALCDRFEAALNCVDTARARVLDALLHEALSPSANNVIDFATARERLLMKREAIACRVIQRLATTRGFGRVRAMKLLYLAEAHCGVALGGEWGRGDFGPFDQWIYRFESDAAGAGWFSISEKKTTKGGTKIEYKPSPELAAKAEVAVEALGDQSAEFERMLTLLANLDTEATEIVATLFAAWNDLLLEGKPVNDGVVIIEVREHWHPSKARFEPAQLQSWMDWLRKHGLVPKGRGPSTRHQPELI